MNEKSPKAVLQTAGASSAERFSSADLSAGFKKTSPSLGLAGRVAAPAATARPNEGGNALPEHAQVLDEAGGGAAAPRLEKRTHFDNAHYRVKLYNYGQGLAEVGWSFINDSNPPGRKGESEAREANEDRAIRRAKSRIRQLVLSTQADHLLTLTYRENMTDFRRASDDLNRFTRKVRRHILGWVYIAVAEQQKRGAWHWHLAVSGRQNVNLLRQLWLEVAGDGNIDVNPPKGPGRFRMLALVKYLSKYLAKGFEEGSRALNKKRFRACHGIEVPVTYLTVPDEYRGDSAGYALSKLREAAGFIGHIWISEDYPAGWACSWE